jgi:hypothetical protein
VLNGILLLMKENLTLEQAMKARSVGIFVSFL